MSLIFNAFLKVPMQFLILVIGVLLFVFYHFERPPLTFNRADQAMLASKAGGELRVLEKNYEGAFEERRAAALALAQAGAGGEAASTAAAERRYGEANQAFEQIREQGRLLVKRVAGREASAEVNYIFPSFLVDFAPAGVLGLMLAVIFAAAMSTFSSEINSLASATIIDFYKRWFRAEAPDAHYLAVSRGATLFWGGVATAAACFAGRLGSLIEAVNRVGSYFYGPILGVFLLAFLVRRAQGAVAFWALIAGEVIVLWVAFGTELSWLYYNVVGAVAVLGVGALLSLGPVTARAGRG